MVQQNLSKFAIFYVVDDNICSFFGFSFVATLLLLEHFVECKPLYSEE